MEAEPTGANSTRGWHEQVRQPAADAVLWALSERRQWPAIVEMAVRIDSGAASAAGRGLWTSLSLPSAQTPRRTERVASSPGCWCRRDALNPFDVRGTLTGSADRHSVACPGGLGARPPRTASLAKPLDGRHPGVVVAKQGFQAQPQGVTFAPVEGRCPGNGQ